MSEFSDVQPKAGFDLSHKVARFSELTDRVDETWSGEFAPYHDDELFIQRLTAQSRLFRRNPELKQEVLGKLTAVEVSNQELAAIAVDLNAARTEVAPANEKPLNTLLSLTTIITELADDTQHLPAEVQSRVGLVGRLLGDHIADSFRAGQLIDAQAAGIVLSDRLERLSKVYPDEFYATFYCEKMEQFGQRLTVRRNMMVYMESYGDIDETPVADEDIAAHSAYVSSLFDEMRATQRYGVKMGYVPDDQIGSFVFNPSVDLMSVLGGQVEDGRIDAGDLLLSTNAIADIIHSKSSNPKRLKPNVHKRGKDTVMWSVSELSAIGIMHLGKDGEIYIDRQCRDPLVKIAADSGKYGAYRKLQAKLLAHYYDATHAVASGAGIMTVQPAPGRGDVKASSQGFLESIERLVVPRLRNQENVRTENDEEDHPIRTVRRHDVTWHVRRLPQGWKASQAAIDLAKELNVRLGEDETIVKDHKRGSQLLGSVVGYKLIRRQ